MTMIIHALIVVAAVAVGGNPVPTDTSTEYYEVMLGSTVKLDGTQSQGHPSGYEWCFLRPDGEACEVYSHDETLLWTPDTTGVWTIYMTAMYDHEISPGVKWKSMAEIRVIVHNVLFADGFESGDTSAWTQH